jgi:hypothetical protein
MNTNPCIDIFLENATTIKERNEMLTLLEMDHAAVNNVLVTNLYKSAIDKSHIDFDRIPESKGDITKYTGYKSMVQCIQIVRDLAKKSGVKVPEVDIVDNAIENIINSRDLFQKGFQLDKEFIIIQYNTLVYACVASVSAIISSYVDYVKRVDKIEFELIKGADRNGVLLVQTLVQFNTSARNGSFQKAVGAVLNTGAEGFTGIAVGGSLALGIVAVLSSIVPITREIIFFGYYSRMKLSDFLEQQASLIDANRNGLDNFVGSPTEKKNIIHKQEALANKLRRLSDRVKVNRSAAEREATVNLKKENKTWTLGDVQTQVATDRNNGFQLI